MKPPRLDERELRRHREIRTTKPIFMGSGIDAWAEEIPTSWIVKVLEECGRNTYLFQSKNPHRFLTFLDGDDMPSDVILGTTIETDQNNYSKGPDAYERATAMHNIKTDYDIKTMLTIEPVIDFNLEEMLWLAESCKPEWVNIGADSKGHNLPEPSPEKLYALINGLKRFTEVKVKTNLNRILEKEAKDGS